MFNFFKAPAQMVSSLPVSVVTGGIIGVMSYTISLYKKPDKVLAAINGIGYGLLGTLTTEVLTVLFDMLSDEKKRNAYIKEYENGTLPFQNEKYKKLVIDFDHPPRQRYISRPDIAGPSPYV